MTVLTPRDSLRRATLGALGTIALLAAPACGGLAAAGPTALDRPVAASLDPRIDVPVFRATTALERESRVDAGRADRDESDERKVTPALFWTGIIVGSIGAGVGVGSSVAGEVAERRLNDGYEQGMSRDRRDRLATAGDRANALAITGAVLGVAGFVTAITAYGVDWNRCGPVLGDKGRERRGCDAYVPPPEVPEIPPSAPPSAPRPEGPSPE